MEPAEGSGVKNKPVCGFTLAESGSLTAVLQAVYSFSQANCLPQVSASQPPRLPLASSASR